LPVHPEERPGSLIPMYRWKTTYSLPSASCWSFFRGTRALKYAEEGKVN
jgi:hypothetical protein